MKVKLTRKQLAPRNVAANALRQGQFRPRVEADPKAYKRRTRHKTDPTVDAAEPDVEVE